MLDVLSKDWVEGILLTCLDLKVNVAMAVLRFTECHLVVELCLLEGLLMRSHHRLNEFLGHSHSCVSLLSFTILSVVLSFLLEVLGRV